MNLASTIEINAGGEGSGCRGDDCGRKEFYHGTTIENARKIVKQGLQPGNKKNWSIGNNKKVYLSEDFQRASHFSHKAAANSSRMGSAIVVFKVPEKIHKNFENDGRVFKSWKYSGSIPKEYITEVYESHYPKNPDKNPWDFKEKYYKVKK